VKQQTAPAPAKRSEGLRVLFCVNWPVDTAPEADAARFSPDYKVSEQPYWFFKHGQHNLDVDVLDCRSFLGLHRLERKLVRCYPSKSTLACIRSRRYDIVISHGGQMGLVIALLQTLFPRASDPPHVMFDVGAVSGGYSGSSNPLLIKGCRFAVKSLAGVISHSSHQIDFYQSRYPELASVAHFIPVGVDIDAFCPAPTPQEDEILSIGVDQDLSSLVRAYACLNTKTRLVLLGIPSSQKILHPGVECIPPVNIEEMRRLIRRARFVVLPLRNVDFCIGQQRFLQSMAMGKTVLLPDIPAVRDYIRDGETGVLYKAGSEQDLCLKLRQLFTAGEMVQSIGRAARAATETEFSEARMAERIIQLLRNIVDARKTVPRNDPRCGNLGIARTDGDANANQS
jgi:glycosyltransferase involved in cell wall biosynthesis